MDVVFSLQRAGSDAVFSWQFPVEVAAPTPSGGILDGPRLELKGIVARDIAELVVPLFEMGVFDA